VRALVAVGVLSPHQGDVLINKLLQIQAKIANGQTNAAINQLGAFINQVQAFTNNGTLNGSQGLSLIGPAIVLQNSLVPPPPPPPTSISSCTSINASGSYVVVADLTSAGTCITINVDTVSLDLNGHTITGPSAGGDGTSGIAAVGRTMLNINGSGTISNFGRGISFETVTNSQVTGVTLSGNFFGFVVNANSSGNTFSNNTSTGNNQHGFTMNGANNNTFMNNVASNNGAHGILLFVGTGNHLEGNTAQNNGDTDLADSNAACDSNVWINNIFTTSNQACIH
jgi:parallel beta-helix repeat protein